ncbi:ABC transporter permease [Sulfobacillus harzensis]|uniref:ABC transporter permease n=1 Tax=Sulfobacillus harzensis TaxID=2729629 RepID=A0A7Y0Q3D0_9FIRM|nr:ABC transporter permease [Sulfobacillus harzensis]NMP22069.1 ABC transporter permease [Sulfobacillus harzensis]
MRMDDLARQAWRPLWTYKLRSGLSLLGIFIGVAAVIALMTLMKSASSGVSARIENLGSNLVVVTMNPLVSATNSHRDLTLAEANRLTTVKGVAVGAPVDYETSAVTARGKKAVATIYASTPPLTSSVLQYHLAYGRYLTRVDEARHLDVAVLGAETSRTLFGPVNPVGRTVMIDGEPDTVVGVLAAKGAFFDVNQDAVAMVPLTAFRDQHGSQAVDSVYLRTRSSSVTKVVNRLGRHLNHWVGGSARYTILTQSQILNLTQEISHLLTQVLVGVAAISIVVGGIGMLNVLLISVSERVREIGVRKSLGARGMDILLQFLLEAVLISGTGGILGVGAGVGISWEITRQLHLSMHLSPIVPLVALAFSVGLGMLFGIYPAARAARLAPAVALRCE